MNNFFKKIFGIFKQGTDHVNSNYIKRPADYSSLYKKDNVFDDVFFSNLVRTINWTQKIIDGIRHEEIINYTTVLRTTNPLYKGSPFYLYTDSNYSSVSTPEIGFNYAEILGHAIELRKNDRLSLEDITQAGRILEFDIDLTTHNGAPCFESDGFVDESDIPPIDTWFYITRTKLYCWIPEMFVEKMQSAIDVEILDAYRWIKDSNSLLQSEVVEKLTTLYKKQL